MDYWMMYAVEAAPFMGNQFPYPSSSSSSGYTHDDVGT